MGNTIDGHGLAHLKKMSDNDLVKNAGTMDMAVLVEANIRLKNSNEWLSKYYVWANDDSANCGARMVLDRTVGEMNIILY